jgi:hypothetical protein
VSFSTKSTACSVVADIVTFVQAGSCEILADQAGGVDYAAAPQASQTFDVAAQYGLRLEATPVLDRSGNPNWIDVTVYGLPADGTAVLTASGPDDLHTIGQQDCPCQIQGPSQTVRFSYNTQQSPTATLTFTANTSTTGVDPDVATVVLTFPMDTQSRSFSPRIQS